jgi:hypothetical protein
VIEGGRKQKRNASLGALENFGSGLQQRGETCAVVVPQDDLDFASFFAALDDCLRDNAIPAIRGSFGNRNYVMEPAS